ncbi:MAG: hypothetical protein Kow00127_18360 [Bacteroidales bacterium]
MKQNLATIAIFLIFPLLLPAQGSVPAEEISRAEGYARSMIGYLEETLNFLGDPEVPFREKEVVVNESYLKIFSDETVQIEDDLDPYREVTLRKDVAAYLKDIQFFFRSVTFRFELQSMQHYETEQHQHYFLATLNRTIEGITVSGDTISNKLPRFIEINFDVASGDLKIASIYTTRFNQEEEIRNWWSELSPGWREILGSGLMIEGKVRLADVVWYNDSLVVVHRPDDTLPESGSEFDIDLPDERRLITGSYDTVFGVTKEIKSAIRSVLKTELLDLSGREELRDLTPLDFLHELKTVNLSSTTVEDLFPLRNLNRLEELICSRTPVDDLSPLRFSKTLKHLDISYTLVDDLSPLEALTELTFLDLSGLDIDDLSVVGGLTGLQSLNLDDTPVSDLSPVESLTRLRHLSMRNSRIYDIRPLKELTHLISIDCENTGVDDLSPLQGLNDLSEIHIGYTPVADLSPLAGLNSLKKIYWDGDDTGYLTREMRKQKAIEFMRSNPGTLVIFESELLTKGWEKMDREWKDLLTQTAGIPVNPTREELHTLLRLDTLIAAGRNLTSLYPLEHLFNLEYLDLSGVPATDFSPLRNVSSLRVLKLRDCNINNLDILSGLTHLEVLDISNTPVVTLDPIASVASLELVLADGSGIKQEDVEEYNVRHPGCVVVYRTSRLAAWWDSLSPAWKEAWLETFPMSIPPESVELHRLTQQQSLILEDFPELKTLSPLTLFSNLEQLTLTGLSADTLEPLAGLKRLSELTINRMPVTDLSPLAALSGLKKLDLQNTPVEDASPLKNLTSLEHLNLSGTRVINLKPLSNSVRLKFLAINNTRVKKLKAVAGLSTLEELQCFNSLVSQREVSRFQKLNPDCKVVYY